MNIVKLKLTIFFEEPFWVGVLERWDEDYKVGKVIFGSEPKDSEVYNLILNKYYNIKFNTAKDEEIFFDKKINPKRLQRKIKKEVKNKGISTKAQQALKEELMTNKLKRKSLKTENKRLKEEIKFQLKQEKKKEKKKGH